MPGARSWPRKFRYVTAKSRDAGYSRLTSAEAVMRHALETAVDAHGETPTMLHATDAGRPIYARMGYQTIASHTAFIEKRFLEGH